MAGTLIADVIQSDQSYPSSINIASPIILSNTFAIPAGTAGAPALAPTGDTNTGIFFPAADTVGLSTNGSEQVRITVDRYVRLASGTGGIQFRNNTAATAALDDYEEGTWTPSKRGITTAGTFTPGADNSGRYTKIGNTVYINAVVDGVLTGASGTRVIEGLPYFQDVQFAVYVAEDVTSGTATASLRTRSVTAGPDGKRLNYLFGIVDGDTNTIRLTGTYLTSS